MPLDSSKQGVTNQPTTKGYMNYAKAIKTTRAARGLDKKTLAKRLKVDASYVSLIEAGRRVPITAMV